MRAEALLPDLIRRAGRSPHDVIAGVAPHLAALGFAERRTREGPEAVLFTRGKPTLCLSGHVDVVPEGEGWTRDPHGGETAEGRIWGRGACDMLGAVAAYAGAAGLAPDAPCAILLTTDEETKMGAAEGALRDGLLLGIRGVVVGEPTSFAVGRAEKGVLWLRVRTQGRNAHGSMPELGDNAADRLVRALHALQGAPLPGRHPLLGAPTLSLGKLASGEAVNQVPASAAAELDIRYLPGMAHDQVNVHLTTAFARAGESPRVETLGHHPPFETPEDAPLVQAAVRAVAKARGAAPPVLGLPYGTEASRYAPAGFPCVILGPGEQALAHTNQESIAIAALREAEETYAFLLRDAA
ncbi:MAG: succinyl-diaminopimelate desuccinylase [Thermoplasmata archaeon]|nr:succinyl-diaminopimelate desuccinylase [Thermoplasmata archaeon]